MGVITMPSPATTKRAMTSSTPPHELIEIDNAFKRLADPATRNESIQFIADARVYGSEPIRNRVFDNIREITDVDIGACNSILSLARIRNARKPALLLRNEDNDY